jgi:amino acid adenylation domain-containing protein
MSDSSHISTLSAKRRALLQILLEKEKLGPSAAKKILPRKSEGPAPLSFAQQWLWLLDQFETGNVYYNTRGIFRLRGPLNVAALKQSLDEIVRRHQVLRTTFPSEDGRPRQVITPHLSIPLPTTDLCQLAENAREAEMQRLVAQESMHHFDLARGPLVRARLLRLTDREHVFVLLIPHIISDGWTMSILYRELAALYEAFSAGKPSPLPELPIQYADYAVWQREWLQGEVLDELLSYWQKQLAGAPPTLELPTNRPRSASQTFRGSRYRFAFSQSLTEEIKALSQQEGTTLFMTLLAAFKALLQRYTGQGDIVVGTVVAGRNRAEIEELLGCFINILVLRTNLSDNPTFRQLLGRVRQVTLGAYAHQDMPFERLVEELQPDRDVDRTPLFQVLFEFQNFSMPELQMGNITLTRLRPSEEEANFGLGIELYDTLEGIGGSLEYSTDLFDAEAIARMVGHFQTLLAGIVANPEQRLPGLPLLTAGERHQLLVEWNDTTVEYPPEQCLHQLFEAQAQRTPDAIAAVCDAAHLSYRQLDRRANRLASTLAAHNVGPDTIVALLAGRNLDFLTAMLAIFKAGGAYLPLDPRHPAQRLGQVLVQSRIPLVLSADDFVSVLSDALASLPAAAQPLVLRLSRVLQQKQPADNLPARCTPRHLAYVIYTSGSTGLPKGAMVEQRGAINHLHAKIRDLQLTDSDIVAQTAPQSFDISVWQFLAALLVGGRVQIYHDEVASDPARLLEQISEHRATILETVPSLLQTMLESMTPGDLKQYNLTSLRWLMPTGEALPPDLARQWSRYQPNVPLINAYGPTECSDDVTHYPFTRLPDTEALRVPIGRPIANMQLYILDTQLELIPVGLAGELYIGGVGVGRGYHNRPDLTAQAFVPHPLSDKPGARLYETGDLARYLPDGNVEFLDRIDYQVKIRGLRIELGEIEAALGQHPEIQQAVVVAWEDSPVNKRLVAYVVPTEGCAPTMSELRSFLKQKLPEYMAPSVFVALAALPLTPNGKVNRKALPPPGPGRPGQEKTCVAPRTLVEKTLAEIWQETLGIEKIGVHDNFFEMGGHSLLAVRLMSRLSRAFQVQWPLRTLFERPTVAALADLLQQRQDTISESSLAPIQADGDEQPFFCVHPIGGSVFCYTALARHLGPERPFYGIQARGLSGEGPPFLRLEDMAAYYIETIRGVQPEGPYLLGGWSMGGVVAYEMAQQLYWQGQKVALLAVMDMAAPRTVTRANREGEKEQEIREALLTHFFRHLGVPLERLDISWNNLLQLEPDEQLSHIIARAKAAGQTPPDIEYRHLPHHFNVFRANIQAMQNYVVKPYPGRVTLFAANEPANADRDSSLGWGKLATGGVEIHTIAGDHFAIIRSPHVEALAKRLKSCLDDASDS